MPRAAANNNIEEWLVESIHPIGNVINVASRINESHKLARRTLLADPEYGALNRMSMLAAIIHSTSLDLPLTAEVIAKESGMNQEDVIKRFDTATARGWKRVGREWGDYELTRSGPLCPDTVLLLDHVVSDYKADFTRDKRKTTVEHRQRAMQLAAQLPDNHEDASQVLNCLLYLLDGFLYERSASSKRSNIALLKPSVRPENK